LVYPTHIVNGSFYCLHWQPIYQRVVATNCTTVVKCRFRWAIWSQILMGVIHCSTVKLLFYILISIMLSLQLN